MNDGKTMKMLEMLAEMELSQRRADIVNHLVGEGMLEGRDAHFFLAGLMAGVVRENTVEEGAKHVCAVMESARLVLPDDPSCPVSAEFKNDLSISMLRLVLAEGIDSLNSALAAERGVSDSE